MDTSDLGSRILARLLILDVTGFNSHLYDHARYLASIAMISGSGLAAIRSKCMRCHMCQVHFAQCAMALTWEWLGSIGYLVFSLIATK